MDGCGGVARSFARDERLRQEQLIACSAYAASLTDLKRGLISLWFHRSQEGEPVWREAHTAADQLGASAAARAELYASSLQQSLLTPGLPGARARAVRAALIAHAGQAVPACQLVARLPGIGGNWPLLAVTGL